MPWDADIQAQGYLNELKALASAQALSPVALSLHALCPASVTGDEGGIFPLWQGQAVNNSGCD